MLRKKLTVHSSWLFLLRQFYGPVGIIEELLPTAVTLVVEMYMNNRIAPRFDGFGDEFHMGLFRGPTALLDITLCARTYHILPRRAAPHTPWYHVIKRQLRRWMLFAAILAQIAVASINIPAIELDRRPRQTIIEQQPDDSWHCNIEIHCRYPIVVIGFKIAFELTQLAPTLEVVI